MYLWLYLMLFSENHSYASEREHAIDVLRKVRGTMIRAKIWKVKILITNKIEVPLLRVTFLPLNMDLDIVASNPIGLYDSDIFRHLMGLQPEATHLFHFIRKWINDLNDIHMKKMIVFYLTVFYLQRVKVLPTLELVHAGVAVELHRGT